MTQVSLMRFYSLGIVAANKPLSSADIEVVPIEVTQAVDGELSDMKEVITAAAKDIRGGAYAVEVETKKSIKATWYGMGRGNRLTPPDLRRGDPVIIWQFGNADKYYWDEVGDLSLRRLETVIFAFSATKDDNAVLSAENCYMFEVNTHQGHIHMHTSEANGEFCGYDFQFNAKEGFVQLQDTVGQSFMVNSKERQLEMLNNDDSKILIDKRSIFVESLDLIAMKSKKFTLDGEEMIANMSKSNTLTTKANKVTTDTEDLQAKTITINTDTQELTAQTNTITATSTHNGAFSVKGTLGVSQMTTMSGGMKWVGGGKGSGTIEVDKLISAQAIRAPNVTGG